ncbi:MAG TPA: hypothetical protein VH395_08950 [Jatrophihabitantaceae bacterium]
MNITAGLAPGGLVFVSYDAAGVEIERVPYSERDLAAHPDPAALRAAAERQADQIVAGGGHVKIFDGDTGELVGLLGADDPVGDAARAHETIDEMAQRERRPGEPTAVYLGRVLDILGLHEMADRARAFHFDDYFCPPEIDDGGNINRLVDELTAHARAADDEQSARIREVIAMAIDGAFDGTREESDQWAASPDGQATFHALFEGR